MKMWKVLTTAAVALGLIATTSMAEANIGDPVDVEVTVTVEEIAELNVIEGAGSMVIDDSSDTFMGNPSSQGSHFSVAEGNLAVVEMRNNFKVDGLQLDFPRTHGIDHPADYFGRATTDGGDVLGVWPQMGYLENDNIVGGGGGILSFDGTDNPLVLKGETRDALDGFESGIHQFGIGVSTNWDRVPPGVQVAEPGDYKLTLTATIVPAL